MGKWDEWVRQRSEFDRDMQRYEDERRPPMLTDRPTVSESERTSMLTSPENMEFVAGTLESEGSVTHAAIVRAAAARLRELETLLSAARTYIDASPCDPDITAEQKAAWQEYERLLLARAHTESEDCNG